MAGHPPGHAQIIPKDERVSSVECLQLVTHYLLKTDETLADNLVLVVEILLGIPLRFILLISNRIRKTVMRRLMFCKSQRGGIKA